jgi:glycosyltransferase involved in cell wall biosynthesis
VKSINGRKQLNNRKKIIHVITRLDKGGSAEDTIVLASGMRKDYDVILVKGSPNESAMSPEEEHTLLGGIEAAQRNGVRIVNLPSLVRRISPIDDVKAFWALFTMFRKENPDIVHTHTSKAGFLGRWAAFLARIPSIVHTPHGHVFYDYFNIVSTKCFIVAERTSALITDKIIAVSNREREEHLEHGVGHSEKFITIHSGVALDRFIDLNVDIKSKKRALGIPEGYHVIGTIGRLVRIKGHRYLIEAAKGVIEKNPKTIFVFVGDGDLKGMLESQAEALGIRKNIIFAGWRNDIAEILYTFDIFVLPSLNEGMGKVLVEAMAACKPIVASKVGGIIDLVNDDVNGILVPPKDPDALRRGILRLLTNKDLAEELGKYGRNMVYPNFDASMMIHKTEKIYEALRAYT